MFGTGQKWYWRFGLRFLWVVSPPLKKPHVLVGANSHGIPLSLQLWGKEPMGTVLHHRLHPELDPRVTEVFLCLGGTFQGLLSSLCFGARSASKPDEVSQPKEKASSYERRIHGFPKAVLSHT